MELKEKILELMKNKNIKNVRELSILCGIPYTTLRSIVVDGISNIRISTAMDLCKFFDVTLDELLQDNIDLPEIKTAAYQGLDTEGLDVTDVKEVNEFIKFVKSKKNNK